MEDDDELTSSPTPNGRIAVTVAAPAPQLPHNSLTLALPIQQQHPQKTPGSGREDCWSEGATAVLIDAWGERYLELSRGNLRQKHWKEVADIVSSRDDYTKTPKTDIQCKNRIDTVKKKYKVEKAKINSGGGPSQWKFYDRLDELIGPAAKINNSSSSATPPPALIADSTNNGNNNIYQRVPMGIPVSRSAPLNQDRLFQNQQKKPNLRINKRPLPEDSDDDDSEPDNSGDSSDGLPPVSYNKRPRPRTVNNNASGSRLGMVMNKKGDGGSGTENKNGNWGNSMRELTRAILKFGEVYEQAETAKLQQLVKMEKQRMKFAKEMELQRMQFFMKTQLELSQLNHRRSGNNSNHNGINNNDEANNNNNINNNSDSSN